MRKLFATLLVLVVAAAWWSQRAPLNVPQAIPPSSAGSLHPPTARPTRGLPPEAADTLARIAAGGPFAHAQDGVVFGNYEGLLPRQPRGYYHEYTVETPGARTRGARRIITGGQPPVVYYYTADHYRSFRRFEPSR